VSNIFFQGGIKISRGASPPFVTGLRQTQTLLCPFLAACLLFVFLDRVMWLPFDKVTFAYY